MPHSGFLVGARVRLSCDPTKIGTIVRIGGFYDPDENYAVDDGMCVQLENDERTRLVVEDKHEFEVILSPEAHYRLKFPSYLDAIADEEYAITEIHLSEPCNQAPDLVAMRFCLDDTMAESLFETIEDARPNILTWTFQGDCFENLSRCGWDNIYNALSICQSIETVCFLNFSLNSCEILNSLECVKCSAKEVILVQCNLDNVSFARCFTESVVKDLFLDMIPGTRVQSLPVRELRCLQRVTLMNGEIEWVSSLITNLAHCPALLELRITFEDLGNATQHNELQAAFQHLLSEIDDQAQQIAIDLDLDEKCERCRHLRLFGKHPNSIVQLQLEPNFSNQVALDDLDAFLGTTTTLRGFRMTVPADLTFLASGLRKNTSLRSLSLRFCYNDNHIQLEELFHSLANREFHGASSSGGLRKLGFEGDQFRFPDKAFILMIDLLPKMAHLESLSFQRTSNDFYHRFDDFIAKRLNLNTSVQVLDIDDQYWQGTVIESILTRNKFVSQALERVQCMYIWPTIFAQLSTCPPATYMLLVEGVASALVNGWAGKRKRQ